MDLVSIVVPCFNEEKVLHIFYKEISVIMNSLKEKCNFELIFVDDGSKDETLNIIKDLALKSENITYISFSRNFGKESAIYAGLEKSKGDFVVLMDADLQDPPELLEEMVTIVKNKNYDCVCTRRVSRKGEPAIRSFLARMFYSLINKISKTEIVDGARDYRLMTRQVVNSILNMKG